MQKHLTLIKFNFPKHYLKEVNKGPPVTNFTINAKLKLKKINDKAKCFYKRFHNYLGNHTNPLTKNLASATLPGNLLRHLKRNLCRDLL